jgi:hypothetical protein
MKDHRRRILLALCGVIGLGMALVAQPTEFHERVAGTGAANDTHWVPGTDIPMSGFERSVTPATVPH